MNKNNILDLIFPPRCPMCDEVMVYGGGHLCGRHSRLPYVEEPVCMKCGKTITDETQELCRDCSEKKKSYIKCFPIFNYVEPVRGSVLRVKYNNRREYLDYYSQEMLRKLYPIIRQVRIDGLVPVPIHNRKLKERGFNQAAELAVRLSKLTNIPVYDRLLIREEYTAPQKQLGHEARYKNIKGAIRTDQIQSTLDTVILIDDIYTTGATAEECTKALHAAGIANVYVAVICIGAGE